MRERLDLIFDFGANAGQNLKYYLSRAKKVVAVEANPELCDEIKRNFQAEIVSHRLVVENFVIIDKKELSGKAVDFYLSRQSSRHSQIDAPEVMDDFQKIQVQSATASEIIRAHLSSFEDAFYVKIDLEGFDQRVLRELFENQIFPTFLSAESHNVETFAAMIDSGAYRSFSLVNGVKIPRLWWRDEAGFQYSFPRHSAGPFGEDIVGKWFDADTFTKFLALEGFGWKDIHATNIILENEKSLKTSWLMKKLISVFLLKLYQKFFPSRLRIMIEKFRYLFKMSKLRGFYRISRLKYLTRTLFFSSK